MNVRPRLGDWRVAIVVVETSDQATLSAADAATLTQMLRDEIFTGVARGGVIESTRLFFAAVSSNNLNLVDAGILTPVRLPNAWDTYVAPDMTTGRTQGDGLPNFSHGRRRRDRATEPRSRGSRAAAAARPRHGRLAHLRAAVDPRRRGVGLPRPTPVAVRHAPGWLPAELHRR